MPTLINASSIPDAASYTSSQSTRFLIDGSVVSPSDVTQKLLVLHGCLAIVEGEVLRTNDRGSIELRDATVTRYFSPAKACKRNIPIQLKYLTIRNGPVPAPVPGSLVEVAAYVNMYCSKNHSIMRVDLNHMKRCSHSNFIVYDAAASLFANLLSDGGLTEQTQQYLDRLLDVVKIIRARHYHTYTPNGRVITKVYDPYSIHPDMSVMHRVRLMHEQLSELVHHGHYQKMLGFLCTLLADRVLDDIHSSLTDAHLRYALVTPGMRFIPDRSLVLN